jgi:hypothetical protein
MYSMWNHPGSLLGRVLLLATVLWSGRECVRLFRDIITTGATWNRSGASVSRADSPRRYWVYLTCLTIGLLLLACTAIGVVASFFSM